MSILRPKMRPYRRARCDFIGMTPNDADLTSYTFPSVALGGAGLIALVAHGSGISNAARVLNSITVGGVGANIVAATNPSFSNPAVIAYLRVGEIAAADIGVNWNGSMSRCAVGVYRIRNNQSDTPVDYKNANSSGATALSVSLGIPRFGVAVFGAGNSYNGTNSFTWSNAGEDYDQRIDTTGSLTVTGAHLEAYNGSTPLSVTATALQSGIMALSGVSWF